MNGMSVAFRRPMTQEEFFDWAEAQDGRYEFDGVQPVTMVGGTNNHGLISRNLNTQLYLRLRGTRCRSMPSAGGGVQTHGKAVRYPDATVSCSPIQGRKRLMPEPVVVFEVLSPSSGREDLVEKPVEYAAVPSIRRYVIVDQDAVKVRGYVRTPDGDWTEIRPLGLGDELELPRSGSRCRWPTSTSTWRSTRRRRRQSTLPRIQWFSHMRLATVTSSRPLPICPSMEPLPSLACMLPSGEIGAVSCTSCRGVSR